MAFSEPLAERVRRTLTGRPMSTMVFVEPAGVRSDDDLERWVSRALGYVATLPPK